MNLGKIDFLVDFPSSNKVALNLRNFFVCFKGRSGYRGLPWFPLCLTNRICICRVPQKHGQSKSGRYIRAFLSYGAFFSFEIRGSYLQIMNHLKDRYVQFVKSSYLLFFILCMVLGPYRRKNRNYSSHNHATLLFWFPSDRAVTTCTRARVLPDLLLPWVSPSKLKRQGVCNSRV